jgi:electron transport complex protein RnfD
LETTSLLDEKVSAFLNSAIFQKAGSELPSGYIDLLLPRAPGIIADRGLLFLLAGTIIITAFEISRSWAPVIYLGVLGLLIRIFGALPFAGGLWNGDVLFALFSGGTMAASFILIADPSTGAKSKPGLIAASVFAAFFTWLFRYQGFEFYGAFFAVALVNAFTPVLRILERRYFYSQEGRLTP